MEVVAICSVLDSSADFPDSAPKALIIDNDIVQNDVQWDLRNLTSNDDRGLLLCLGSSHVFKSFFVRSGMMSGLSNG